MLAVDYVDPINYTFASDKNIKQVIRKGYYTVANKKFTGKIVKFVNNKFGFVYDKPQIAGLYVLNYFTIENGTDSFDSVKELINNIEFEFGDFQ